MTVTNIYLNKMPSEPMEQMIGEFKDKLNKSRNEKSVDKELRQNYSHYINQTMLRLNTEGLPLAAGLPL